MATILKSKTPSLESFEETYKTAYSHGLEAIYSLQTVDLKTVRKINDYAPEVDESPQEKKILFSDSVDFCGQMEIDLGEEFSESISPYFLMEPIKVLGLSLQAESCLLEQGFRRINDLRTNNLRDYVFMKGMGQGHIDEVQKKLQTFIDGRSFKKTNIIDFNSLLLSLCDGINFKKASLFLRDYQLEDVIPLTPSEKIELKTFDLSKNPSLRNEVLEMLDEPARKKEAFDHLEKITKVFISPWIQSRGGLASKEEIIERLEKVSLQPAKTTLFLDFFAENFNQSKFAFSPFLLQCQLDVFSCSEKHFSAYHAIVESALTYFYKNNVYYTFDTLVSLLYRDFAKQWEDYSEEFIRECLKRSPYFCVARAVSGKLEVRLA